MKLLINTIILLLSFFSIYAQNIDCCGIDNYSVLSKQESEFLNDYLKEQRGEFDFLGKKILFITGSNGSTIGDKSEYFSNIRKWEIEFNSKIATDFIILHKQEKEESGGYDAILTYWVKVFVDNEKKKQKIIKLIKTRH